MSLRGHRASWLISGLPGSAPIKDGAIVLDDAERVVAVGPAATLALAFPQLAFARHAAVLLPGLVNAHLHLELSALRGETRSGAGFGPWVTGMMEKRAQLQPFEESEAIEAAVSELLRSGTVALGEVTNSLAGVEALSTAPLLGRVFHEIFGMARASAQARMDAAGEARQARAHWPDNLSYVLAPHTLYSLHPDSVREILRLAGGAKTSLHLAEHPAERAFLIDGSGPFADFLRARDVPTTGFTPPNLSPVVYADQLGALSPSVLAVHLCATTREELRLVAERGSKVVLCPRSNLFIELKLPPLFDMLELGIEPALGSDSLASNTTLDVLAEAAALHDRFPQVDGARFITMATWNGAVALGLEHRVGALQVGLSPGLLAVDLPDPDSDPYKVLLRSPPPPRRVLARPAMPTSSHPLGEPA